MTPVVRDGRQGRSGRNPVTLLKEEKDYVRFWETVSSKSGDVNQESTPAVNEQKRNL